MARTQSGNRQSITTHTNLQSAGAQWFGVKLRTSGNAWYLLLIPVILGVMLVTAGAAHAWQGQAVISSPQPFSTLRGVVSLNGTATHPEFQRFQLYFKSESVPDDWHFMFEQTNQVTNGLLGTWDTRSVPDGTYALRLRVVRQDGNYDETVANGLLVANSRPVDTPTPTPTEEPPDEPEATSTPASTPTPVVVEQPQIATPTPRPALTITNTTALTTTSAVTDTSSTGDTSSGDSGDDDLLGGLLDLGQVSDSLSLNSLGDAFMRGARVAVMGFLLFGAYLVLRWLFRFLRTRLDT